MEGTQYVVEQLGQALKASHEALGQQAQRIAELEALLADALGAEATAVVDGPEAGATDPGR